MGKSTARPIIRVPPPKRCMLRFYILAFISVLIIAYNTAPTVEEMRNDANIMHSMLKNNDQE